MSNLVPEQRPDKNGKPVTRWVLPGTPPNQQKRLPSPKISSEPTASQETLEDFDDFLSYFDIAADNRTERMRARIATMPAALAKRLVEDLHTDSFRLGNVESLASLIESIYGYSSPVAPHHRATVFANALSIIPEYGMTDEDPDIISHTRIIFDAVDGYSRTTPFSDEEKIGYQTAACLMSTIYPRPHENKADLNNKGLQRAFNGSVRLKSRDAVDVMVKYASRMDALREELLERGTFDADLVEAIAAGGALSSGVL